MLPRITIVLCLLEKMDTICYSNYCACNPCKDFCFVRKDSFMKKYITAFIVLILLCLMSPSVYAADISVDIGGKEVGFDITSDWYFCTPQNIDSHFSERKMLSDELIRGHMSTFNYKLWLINKKTDDEIIVMSESSNGVKDYKGMSSSELNSVISDVVAVPSSFDGLSISKIEKYSTSGVLFVKYSASLNSVPYTVRYDTVSNGNLYQIKLISTDGKINKQELNDLLGIADTVGVALTFPENYSNVSYTKPTVTDKNIVVDLETDPQNADGSAYNIAGGNSPTAVNSTNKDIPTSSLYDNNSIPDNIIEVGTNGETVVIEETYPSDTGSSSFFGVKNAAAICAAVISVAVGLIVVIKLKRNKS